MILRIAILAIIGSFIGWMTNVFAIKLLFRPLEPFKIPILPFKLQGLIPKRRGEIAKSVGETVEKELLSVEDIVNKLIADSDKNEVLNIIKSKIFSILEEKMPSMVPSMFKGMITSYVNEVIESEGENIINELSENIIHHATTKVSVALIIEEKVNDFELTKIESIVLEIAKKELKHIELLGSFLGFIIGLFQGIIIHLI